MTFATTNSTLVARKAAARDYIQIWPVVGVALLGAFAITLPNLQDPMLRHDDFPALFAEPARFWPKTLHEGRWINYLWHLRGMVTPAWLNFAIYQALWAIFAAALATAALGRDRPGWFTFVAALLIVVAPSASLISLWFNTLLPGLAIVALYAVLACRMAPRAHRTLLPPFVIVSFMAYTTYPLLLLAICLARSDNRSARDLAGLLLLFAFSFAAAVLATYALNWHVHGIFGIPLADWRGANPAQGWSGLIENLPKAIESLVVFLEFSSFTFAPATLFHLAMLTVATIVLLHRAPLEALYLHAGLLTGLILVILQALKLGVTVPPRAFIFAWVFYAIILVRATELLSRKPGLSGRMARNFVLLIVGSYMLQTFMQYNRYRPWQAETRKIAQVISSTEGPVILDGDVMLMTSAKGAFVQKKNALNSRLIQLADREITFCSDQPETCQLIRSDQTGYLQLRVDQADGQIKVIRDPPVRF